MFSKGRNQATFSAVSNKQLPNFTHEVVDASFSQRSNEMEFFPANSTKKVKLDENMLSMRSMESKSLSAIRPQKMSSRASDRSGNLAMSIQSVKSLKSYGGISNRSALGMKDYTSGREPVPRLGPFASSSRSVYSTGQRQAGQSQQMSGSYSSSTRQ